MKSQVSSFQELAPEENLKGSSTEELGRYSPKTGGDSNENDSNSLEQWLRLNWFYPEDFRPLSFARSENAYLVKGDSRIYKFIRYPTRSFHQQWFIAASELLDNRSLAKSTYLGLQLWQEVDGEPQATSFFKGSDVRPREAPEAGFYVAIVMRRIKSVEFLDHYLSSEDIPADNYKKLEQLPELIAEKLATFHRRRTRKAQYAYSKGSYDAVFELQARLSDQIEPFIAKHLPFLDSFSQSAAKHIFDFLRSHIEERALEISERTKRGFFIDGHGGLASNSVILAGIEEKLPQIEFWQRSSIERRQADSLRDLALISCDLRLREFPFFADEIEQKYKKHNSEAFSAEHFRFHLALEAFLKAIQLFSAGDAEDVLATKALQIALKASLNLLSSKPLLFVFRGNSADLCEGVSGALAELLGFRSLSDDSINSSIDGIIIDDRLRQERIKERVAQELRLDRSIALSWPEVPEHFLLQLKQTARQAGTKAYVISLQDDAPIKESVRYPRLDFLPESAIAVIKEFSRK